MSRALPKPDAKEGLQGSSRAAEQCCSKDAGLPSDRGVLKGDINSVGPQQHSQLLYPGAVGLDCMRIFGHKCVLHHELQWAPPGGYSRENPRKYFLC